MKKTVIALVLLLIAIGLAGQTQSGYLLTWGDNWLGRCNVPTGNIFLTISAGESFTATICSSAPPPSMMKSKLLTLFRLLLPIPIPSG